LIAVIGLGFVGLTTAVGLAEKTGRKVRGYDLDARKVAAIRGGELPFYEEGLGDALKRHIGGTFVVEDDLGEVIRESEVVFFCVGTPCGEDGQADLGILKSAIDSCLRYVDGYKTLVIKSTVPPSTSERVLKPLLESRGLVVGDSIGLASNPEFLREGTCWQDFTEPDRVVIGCFDRKDEQRLKDVYAPFGAPVECVSPTTAEFIKYLSNTLLATMISYSNELSMIADAIGGIDVKTAFEVLHKDRRWLPDGGGSPSGGGAGGGVLAPVAMSAYVYPGSGFGGYCLPKDTSALAAISESSGCDPLVLRAALETNRRIKLHIAAKVEKLAPDTSTPIGILGLSFKPNSDDVRDTPAKHLIEQLLADGYTDIVAYDPIATDVFKSHYGLPIRYADTLDEVLESCDTLALVTAWDEFKGLKDKAPTKRIVDGRYVL
jgi:UDPglucose 6-dehydrogenase